MSDVKLLPCPFCGGVVECKQYDGTSWQISCDVPECQVVCATPFHSERDRAIAAWNERALTPDARYVAGRLYGLKEAAVIAGCTTVGLDIYKRIKSVEPNAENAPAPALTPKQQAADTPEQMRERCFHDFLRLIQACMNFMDQEEACVLQRFSGFVEQHGIPGLGTGTCDCGEDDCPYKTASVPCDCGLPDCSDPRAALAKAGQQ